MSKIMIPVGIENFEMIRTNNFYYIDKTSFIVELVQDAFSVNLITRPRRFGKTLMMRMAESFFDIRKDNRTLFEGLEVTKYQNICDGWMNQWPTLFVSFKDVAAENGFEDAYSMLAGIISDVCKEHIYLLDSQLIDENDKDTFIELKSQSASKTDIKRSLLLLMRMMHAYYGKQVILLIDEYDVPLSKANDYGYYTQMLDVIRSMMGVALKTNDYLKFSVITGCLRIAKESIFTGTNLFVMNSIYDGSYMDSFGFTEEEVKKLLADTGLTGQLPQMKRWYDGYHFGKSEIYCPWDVVNHVAALQKNPDKKPGNYWRDTSHNNIIRAFIGNEKLYVNEKLEALLSGGSVKSQIRDNLTYGFENATEDDFWSILYLTGYLTMDGYDDDSDIASLKIPNEEVRMIFADTVVEWFKDTMRAMNQTPLMEALWNGRADEASVMISRILRNTISYHNYKEDYYHAFLAGIFTGVGYPVESDKEHGEGRPDIVVKDIDNQRVIIIETKRSVDKEHMEDECVHAVNQIQLQRYMEEYLEDYETVVCYGAAFYRKSCLIKVVEV